MGRYICCYFISAVTLSAASGCTITLLFSDVSLTGGRPADVPVNGTGAPAAAWDPIAEMCQQLTKGLTGLDVSTTESGGDKAANNGSSEVDGGRVSNTTVTAPQIAKTSAGLYSLL